MTVCFPVTEPQTSTSVASKMPSSSTSTSAVSSVPAKLCVSIVVGGSVLTSRTTKVRPDK